MEVDHKPSAGSFAALLIPLILFCAVVPLVWRYERGSFESTASSNVSSLANTDAHHRFDPAVVVPNTTDFSCFGIFPPDHLLPVSDGLPWWGRPTIEELIAAHVGRGQSVAPSLAWPVLQPTLSSQITSTASTSPNPFALSPLLLHIKKACTWTGRSIAEFSSITRPSHWLARLAVEFPLSTPSAEFNESKRVSTISSASGFTASSLRVIGQHTAMVPGESDGRNGTAPRAVRDEPWCVPRVLFDQLERLACHPCTASWAEQTIAQLRALTERKSLEGNDVEQLLAELAASALRAEQLAEETQEDRLRVELLRAHWALARRLDTWGAMDAITAAREVPQRFASRGSLMPYFGVTASEPKHNPSNASMLAQRLEVYEQTREPRLARELANDQHLLASSADSLDRALAEAVEQHYRNANVRLAITAELLNRFVSSEHSEIRPVRDRIAGAPVRGRSHTQAQSHVRLDPAAGRWQMSIEADGVVRSDTIADGGRARLRSHSETEFAASKTIVVDPDGVQLERAVVGADAHNRLVGVTTDFDWLPLVGSYARSRAVGQFRARRQRAVADVEHRVSLQAAEQIDQQTREALTRIEQQVRERITERLAEARIELTPIEMTTTERRIVGRFRVAGRHQLGSHTPRPRAISDSLGSIQIHETALTNAAASLLLEGRRFNGPSLRAHLREKFPRMAHGDTSSERRDVVFHFAAEDAVQFHIDRGRLELTLSLASLEQEGRQLRDITVHAYYVPVVNGLEAELVRDGSLGIEGRFSSADRARLHNVFNSVLPPERRLPILRVENPDDPKLAGLMITQLVLEDGWLGLAVGPAENERVAERSRSLR